MVTDSDVTERVRQQVRPRSRARGESEALVAAVLMIVIAAVWQGWAVALSNELDRLLITLAAAR